ncbi:MAG TPA: VOC family protein, partial [Ferruginibacter sp.]|nr:VOC family protein [Ferruginibacter sp.]
MKKNMLLIAASLFIQVSFAQKIVGAGPVSITVSDMDRSLDFYTKVLPFQKIAEQELYGDPYEKLEGLFGIRMRIALLRLGDEEIELIDYLTAGGRSIP